MKYLFFLTAFILGFSSLAHAKTDIVFCKSSAFASVQIRNNSEFPALSCHDILTEFEQALQKVQRISPVSITPTAMVVYNQTLPKGGRYSWVTSTVTIDVTDTKNLWPKIATFYHEMGHKIYFEAMAKQVPEIQTHLPSLKKYAEYLGHCVQEVPDKKYCDNNKSAEQMLAANNSFSEDFSKFIYITTPYNELFADVVASLAANQQNAIALIMDECTISDPACEYRAFSKNTIDKFAGENTHSRFAPLRRDFWEGWVVPRMNDKPALLLELGDILVNESYTHWETDYPLVEGMSALKQNNRLRELLKLKVTESPTLKYSL